MRLAGLISACMREPCLETDRSSVVNQLEVDAGRELVARERIRVADREIGALAFVDDGGQQAVVRGEIVSDAEPKRV